MTLKFSSPVRYRSTLRQQVLAMPKITYQGKDFFQRPDFRGLYLADFQDKLGDKAFEKIEQLNSNTVRNFGNLKSFKDAITQKELTKGSIRLQRLNTESTNAFFPQPKEAYFTARAQPPRAQTNFDKYPKPISTLPDIKR